MFARSDIVQGILTSFIFTVLFAFFIVCQKDYYIVAGMDPRYISCITLGMLSLIPLKNQVSHTYHLRHPHCKPMLTVEDVCELKRCIIDQTLYFCFLVRILTKSLV